MKKKLLTNHELKPLETFNSGMKKVFDSPPVSVISNPEGGKYFITRFSNYSLISGPSIRMGTICAVRLDWKDFPFFWNADYYYVYSTGTQSLYELVGPDKSRDHKFLILPEDLIPPGMEEMYYSVEIKNKDLETIKAVTKLLLSQKGLRLWESLQWGEEVGNSKIGFLSLDPNTTTAKIAKFINSKAEEIIN